MRLIDADKVKIDSRKHCIDCKLNGTKQCKTCVINLICERLDLQPTIEERQQGKWIWNTAGYFTCSNCSFVSRSKQNFCAECGAEMRGNNNG